MVGISCHDIALGRQKIGDLVTHARNKSSFFGYVLDVRCQSKGWLYLPELRVKVKCVKKLMSRVYEGLILKTAIFYFNLVLIKL